MKSFISHLIEASSTRTLGNVNPVTGKAETGVHEYDPQTGQKTRTWSGSSNGSPSTPQTAAGSPSITTPVDTSSRYTNPQEENKWIDATNTRYGGTKSLPQAKSATQDDLLAVRFPEAYPEKLVSRQFKRDETGVIRGDLEGEDAYAGYEVSDYDPTVSDPNDPKFNRITRNKTGEEYGKEVSDWAQNPDSEKDFPDATEAVMDDTEEMERIEAEANAKSKSLKRKEDSGKPVSDAEWEAVENEYDKNWKDLINLGDQYWGSRSMRESVKPVSFLRFLNEEFKKKIR